MYNKEKYKEILDYCKRDLELLGNEMKSLLLTNKTELELELSDFLFAKSKRLRPVVIFLIKEALNIETNKDIISLVAGLELLHSATLIHDDIIDEGTLRRNLPTLNEKYGVKLATLAGDYLLSLSQIALSKIGSIKIIRIFAQDTFLICKGEIGQFFSKNKITSLEDYLKKSKMKTSMVFLAGAKSLLSLYKQEKEIEEKILKYVEKFSLAFQIYDDIENFKEENGEKISSDVKNGIYTLPYIYLLSQDKNNCDIIDNENLSSKEKADALKFSNEILINTLDEAREALFGLQIKKEMLLRLLDVFKS